MFVFGAIIGSFLNVVIYRLHTGKSLNGRSHCMSCGNTLSWHELFPVVSYLAQRGSCKKCKSYIPFRYFLVELCTAVSFIYIFSLFKGNTALLVLNALFVSFLTVIFVYDLRHMIIPDEMTVLVCAVAALFLLHAVFGVTQLSYQGVLFKVLGGLCASGFFAGLWYISKGRWIGFGDAKLAFPLGVIVGGVGVFSMVVLSFWIGAVVSLALLGIERVSQVLKRGKTNLHFLASPLTIKSEVPFAPFLVAGFVLVHFFHADIFNITYTLFFW